LQPLIISIEQRKGAFVQRTGFVSTDGATVLLGEFRPLGENPATFRQRLIEEKFGRREAEPGGFSVLEVLDFQCERCKMRSPQVRRAIEERGGNVEVHFLPLVKVHDWAFAAAECAAALASASPDLSSRYEEAVFDRQERMTAAAAGELARDMAEAGHAAAKYEEEISSGRARDRVLEDITLAIRLGIVTTPSFLQAGNVISG